MKPIHIVNKSLIVLLMLGLQATVPCYGVGETTKVEEKTQKKVIFSDFHDVVTTMNKSAMLLKLGGVALGAVLASVGLYKGSKNLFNNINIARAAAVLPWAILGGTLYNIKATIKRLKQHGKHDPVMEHVYDQNAFLRLIKPFFVQLSSDYVPNKEIIELYKKKKEEGYALMLVSNLAPESLKVLRNRYPDMFKLFEDTNGALRIISPTEQNGWLDKSKDKKAYYDQMIGFIEKDGFDQGFFVDDKTKNCDDVTEVVKNYNDSKNTKHAIQTFTYNGKKQDSIKQLEEILK